MSSTTDTPRRGQRSCQISLSVAFESEIRLWSSLPCLPSGQGGQGAKSEDTQAPPPPATDVTFRTGVRGGAGVPQRPLVAPETVPSAILAGEGCRPTVTTPAVTTPARHPGDSPSPFVWRQPSAVPPGRLGSIPVASSSSRYRLAPVPMGRPGTDHVVGRRAACPRVNTRQLPNLAATDLPATSCQRCGR